MDKDMQFEINDDTLDLKSEILRYLSFWPYLLILIILSLASSYLYLRYTNVTYEASTTIEVLDETRQ